MAPAFYKDLNEKNLLFVPDSDYPENKIDDIPTFNRWYQNFLETSIYESNNFDYFFRGMSEAKYKLYNSAQREWLLNSMENWKQDYSYLKFIKELINEAKEKPLFKHVLAYYRINYESEADFPIMSILQHYGSPTPLMDWTYNLDVALYFATENVNAFSGSDSIDGYFSIYMINKHENQNLRNIFGISNLEFPSIAHFHDDKFNPDYSKNFACYISDFEVNNEPTPTINSSVPANQAVQKSRPLTSYYNQNIIPQQGLFIFNPSPDKPLENIFNSESSRKYLKQGNLNLSPFFCYNIKKDIADYVRRKINQHNINNAFIYPELRSFLKVVKENVFNNCLKPQ
jgi:hypothetical protein